MERGYARDRRNGRCEPLGIVTIGRRSAAVVAVCCAVFAAVHAQIAGASERAKATVTLGSRPPAGFAAGRTWRLVVTIWHVPSRCADPAVQVSQPLVHLRPVVILTNASSGARVTYPAVETRVLGDYRANVVFPSRGEWQVAVDDRHGLRPSFGTVAVGPRRSDEAPWPASARSGSHPPLHLLPGAVPDVEPLAVPSHARRGSLWKATFDLWLRASCRQPLVMVQMPLVGLSPVMRFTSPTGGVQIARAKAGPRPGDYYVEARLQKGSWRLSLSFDGRRVGMRTVDVR
jgi:hypothetical protein